MLLMTKIMTDDENDHDRVVEGEGDHNINGEGERESSVELGGDARPGSAAVKESWKMQ